MNMATELTKSPSDFSDPGLIFRFRDLYLVPSNVDFIKRLSHPDEVWILGEIPWGSADHRDGQFSEALIPILSVVGKDSVNRFATIQVRKAALDHSLRAYSISTELPFTYAQVSQLAVRLLGVHSPEGALEIAKQYGEIAAVAGWSIADLLAIMDNRYHFTGRSQAVNRPL